MLGWVTLGGLGRATATAAGLVILVVAPGTALSLGTLAAARGPFAGVAVTLGGTLTGVYGLFLIFAVQPVLGGVSPLGLVVFAGGVTGVVAGLSAFASWLGVARSLSVPDQATRE